jgi:hypothetical protein
MGHFRILLVSLGLYGGPFWVDVAFHTESEGRVLS